MTFNSISLNEWITIILLIAQAGVIYYRLKKVEQTTDRFNEIFIEFAVHKNSLQNHINDFEKHAVRVETVIDKLDTRISGIESHAYEALMKDIKRRRDS